MTNLYNIDEDEPEDCGAAGEEGGCSTAQGLQVPSPLPRMLSLTNVG
jgi:hypothetical protein